MKTTLQYDHYYDYDELTAAMRTLHEKYPQLSKLFSIGETIEGRQLWAMEVTDFKTGDFLDKPAQHIDGNTHAGEVTGSMAALHTLDTLLTNHKEQAIATLLKRFAFSFIPRISPDGAEFYLKTPYSVRSVNRPWPQAERQNGLHEEDIDQDGVIRFMRIASSSGAWKKSAGDTVIMERREPDEMDGEFYDLYPESVLSGEKKTRLEMAPTYYSVDFNRNYPCYWLPNQPGAGDYPLDNAETAAVVKFLCARKNIGVMITHHTSGGMILNPPGPWSEKEHDPKDMQIYHAIGKIGTKETGYPLINLFDGFHCTKENYAAGAGDDWAYLNRGIFAVTVELWDMLARAGIAQSETLDPALSAEKRQENLQKALQWVKANCPEAILPWRKVNHPQLGEVEVGGIAGKFVLQNCPPQYLLSECEKVTRFALRQAALLPRLAIENVKIEPFGDTMLKISAEIVNLGYLSTAVSNQRKRLKLNRPVKVTLENARIKEGKQEEFIEALEGYAQDFSSLSITRINPGRRPHNRHQVSWIIEKASAEIKIKAQSETAGSTEALIQISKD